MMKIIELYIKQIEGFKNSSLFEKVGTITLIVISIFLTVYTTVLIYNFIKIIVPILILLIIGVISLIEYCKRKGVSNNTNVQHPLSLRHCLIMITREDEMSPPSESAVNKHFSRTVQRFVSCTCTGIGVYEDRGILVIRFNVVHPLNPLSIGDLKNAIYNDVLNEYRLIFELYGLSIPQDFADYVLIDIRKNKLYVVIAISNVGLQTIAQRRKVLEKNSTLLRNR